MEILEIVLQVLIALTIINVWLFRGNKQTPWRRGNASSMKSESAIYGLSIPAMIAVGGFPRGHVGGPASPLDWDSDHRPQATQIQP